MDSKGYAATTVGDVIKQAGISRRTFYEHFADKQACYLAAYEHAELAVRDAVVDWLADSAGASDLVLAGCTALCSGLSEQPAFAHAYLRSALEAGPVVKARIDATRARAARFFRRMIAESQGRHDELPAIPAEFVAHAIVGALEAILATRLARGAGTDFTGLEATLAATARALLDADIPRPDDPDARHVGRSRPD